MFKSRVFEFLWWFLDSGYDGYNLSIFYDLNDAMGYIKMKLEDKVISKRIITFKDDGSQVSSDLKILKS